jgi:DnaJ-class molecular chaperone
MTSKFSEELEKLENLKCQKCHGTGQIDDADPGDISFNIWTCPGCIGTGLFGAVEHDPQVEGSNTIWLRKQYDNMQNFIEATCEDPYPTHVIGETNGRVVLLYSMDKAAWDELVAAAEITAEVSEG